MLSLFLFFLLILTSFAQISFSDFISSGTFCTPQATSTALKVTCSGKGFFLMDAMTQSQPTTVIFQIVTKSTDFGVGFGQRPDSTCFSSMFPLSGQTWATCTPPSNPALNQPCNVNKCLFNQFVAYTNGTYQSRLAAVDSANPLQTQLWYQWKFQPPTCPLSPPYTCWQIVMSKKNISPPNAPWIPGKTYSSSCSPASYVQDCNSPPKYAIYVELEADGQVELLFKTPTPCSISNCLSCTDPNICDYCLPNYFVGFGKSMCLAGCPVLSSVYFTHCKCNANAIPNSPSECICNPSLNLTFNTTLQECECLPGYYPDPSGFSSYSGPSNCLPCDSSCVTCSGGAANQCITCPSGYLLTPRNTCEIPTEEEDYELDPVSKAGNVGKTISTVGLVGATVASAGSSEAVRISLIGKMFKYLRYLDIAYPKNLRNLLHSKPSDFLSAKTGIKIPESLRDEESYDRAPWVYRRYINLPSSFLVNFWEDILMLLILSAVALLVYSMNFFVKKSFGASQKGKEKTLVENISGKVSILAQSFLIIYMYKDGGDVIFFQILDFRTMNSYSGTEILNPFASVIFLTITVSLIGFHYYIIWRYQTAKSAKNDPKALEEYVTKKENLQIFWKDYKDPLFIHQSFLLILVVRDIAYNFMLGLLFEYPLIQTLLFPCYSFIMLLYIFFGRPFKRTLDNIQHFTCEIILFIVNICVLILAIMDSVGSQGKTTRDNLGTTVIVMNCLFNFTPTAFIVLKVAFLGYEYYQERKAKKREPVKKGDDFSQMSTIDLMKGRRNLDISQVDLNEGTGQIYYQEMEKSGIEYPGTIGEMSIIEGNNDSPQGKEGVNVRDEENVVGNEGGDVVYGDVEEGAGRVNGGEPMRRRKIKKVKRGN